MSGDFGGLLGRPCAGEQPANGATLIAAERQRQISAEGWTPEHDASLTSQQLVKAAVCYLLSDIPECRDDYWPWHPEWFKPTPDDRVRELVKAGALIAAEVDRLRRIEAVAGAGTSAQPALLAPIHGFSTSTNEDLGAGAARPAQENQTATATINKRYALRALAERANERLTGWWTTDEFAAGFMAPPAVDAFLAACSPSTVLELLETLRDESRMKWNARLRAQQASSEAVAASPTSAQAPPEPPEEWVCSWCGDEWDPGDTFSSGCCSCDPMPASGLPAALKDARREAQEDIDEAWDDAVADAKRIALLEAEVARLEAVAEAARGLQEALRGVEFSDEQIAPWGEAWFELYDAQKALEALGGNGVARSAGEPE